MGHEQICAVQGWTPEDAVGVQHIHALFPMPLCFPRMPKAFYFEYCDPQLEVSWASGECLAIYGAEWDLQGANAHEKSP